MSPRDEDLSPVFILSHLIIFLDYFLPAFLHQPLRRTGGTTDAYGIHTLKPRHIYLVGTLYLVAPSIYALAFLEEYFSVTTLPSTDKEDDIVLGGKIGDIRHAIGYLTADGVKALELGTLHDMLLAIVDNAMELIQALGGLRIEEDVLGEIKLAFLLQSLHILKFFYYDGMALGLTYQAKHLGMTVLAKDNYLCVRITYILLLDTLLQLEYHRTGGINNLYVVLLGKGVGLWWFAMGTKKNLHIVKFLHLLMVDGDETCVMQALHLHTIMHNIA